MPDGAVNGGYEVDPAALRRYSGELGNYGGQTGKLKEMVGQADVGNESWGLVGLFTKDGYTQTLQSLKSLMEAMAKGLDSAGSKMTQAADIYQGIEEDHVTTFNKIEVKIDGPKTGGTP
ncbi:WXG100 family type VII secretion target [Amycolatopsis azurea]|uniref:WXG100 family type VII secretion target n=1 Tax=Amycolatopsis azurea TaxID=36819 RepID=UPI00381AE65B